VPSSQNSNHKSKIGGERVDEVGQGWKSVRIARIICAMRTDNDSTAGGGPALFRVVRFWSRRWATGVAGPGTAGPGTAGPDTGTPGGGVGDRGDAGHLGHVLVLEAIDAAARDGVAQIGEVAVELGLDRSNASRMLAAAVAAGLVTKTVSPQDARRTELALTPAGAEMLAAARAWQEQTFRRLTAEWPAEDARRFASYLVRLARQPAPDLQPIPACESGPARESGPAGRSRAGDQPVPVGQSLPDRQSGPAGQSRAGRQPGPARQLMSEENP
jgi:DNA-binding MarR family transcriptional regulator